MLQLWFIANTVFWPLKVKVGNDRLGLNVVLLLFAGAVWLGRSLKVTAASVKILVACVAYIAASCIVMLFGPCHDHLIKSILSIPILILLVVMGSEVGRRARARDWLNLEKSAKLVLAVAFSSLILEMLLPSLFPGTAIYRVEGKFSGLFQEPSHVAVGLFPCAAVLLVADHKRTRQTGMLALLGILVFSRSSTLIAFIGVWILYRLIVQRKLRQTAVFAMGIALLVGLGASVNYTLLLEPTLNRIAGIAAPNATDNVSSLVYVQGWQDTWFNLKRTHGLGLGVNMMGCGVLPDVSARDALALIELGDINSTDGSFMFSKVVSEAGVVGIALYAVIVWWWIQLEKRLHGLGKNEASLVLSAQAALILCFLASSFIRGGGGYFDGVPLLFVAALSGASRWQRQTSPGNEAASAHVSTTKFAYSANGGVQREKALE